MKKLTKMIALAMAGTMALGLTSCGNNGGSSNSSDGVVTLKWVTVGGGQPANYDAWLKQINPYLEDKIGVNLDVEVVGWGEWGTRRNVVVNTASDYDILFTNSNTYNNDVKIGAFMDISELVKTASPKLYESIPADYWEACKVDGKIYAVPTYKDSSQTEYVVWDKELMDSVGYDGSAMKDLSDLTAPLTAIKEKTGEASFPQNKSGATYLTFMYDGMGAGLSAMGVRYDDKDAKVVSIFEQDDIMGYLKLYHQWYQDGIINSDAATKPEANAYTPVSVAQGWSGAAITTWGPNMGVEAVAYQWGPTIVSNDTVRGSLNCISANCANPEKALALLELVNTDSYVRDLLYYGVEGDNWDYTSDAKTNVHKNNSEWNMAGYTQGSFFTVTPTDDFDFNQFDEVKELNEKASPSVLLGFSLDTSSFDDQLTNCIQIAERYEGELLTGTGDPETMVPQMMAELRSAGFDEIQKAAQEQVDAFMASK